MIVQSNQCLQNPKTKDKDTKEKQLLYLAGTLSTLLKKLKQKI